MLSPEEEDRRFAVLCFPPARAGEHDGHARWARAAYDALPSRARVALRALRIWREANALHAVGPRERAVMRAVRLRDAEGVLVAVRAALLAA